MGQAPVQLGAERNGTLHDVSGAKQVLCPSTRIAINQYCCLTFGAQATQGATVAPANFAACKPMSPVGLAVECKQAGDGRACRIRRSAACAAQQGPRAKTGMRPALAACLRAFGVWLIMSVGSMLGGAS